MAAMSKEEQEKIIRQLLGAMQAPPASMRGFVPSQAMGGVSPTRPQAGGQYQPAFAAPTQPTGAAFAGAAPNTMGGSSTLGSVPPSLNVPAPAQEKTAPMQGPANMNVIKYLNQYANMGDPQGYADKFADGDLSKLKARTYRDEEGNPYNDYYIKGLLGG